MTRYDETTTRIANELNNNIRVIDVFRNDDDNCIYIVIECNDNEYMLRYIE